MRFVAIATAACAAFSAGGVFASTACRAVSGDKLTPVIELYTSDYYTGDPDHQPLRWSVNDPRCRSFGGTRAPDSWYDESSLLLGPDGRTVPTEEATVDERDQRSEVMA